MWVSGHQSGRGTRLEEGTLSRSLSARRLRGEPCGGWWACWPVRTARGPLLLERSWGWGGRRPSERWEGARSSGLVGPGDVGFDFWCPGELLRVRGRGSDSGYRHLILLTLSKLVGPMPGCPRSPHGDTEDGRGSQRSRMLGFC